VSARAGVTRRAVNFGAAHLEPVSRVFDVAVRGAYSLTLMQFLANFSQQVLLHSHDSGVSVDVGYVHANVVALATSTSAAKTLFRDSMWVLRKVTTATAQRFTRTRTQLVSDYANAAPCRQTGNVSRLDVLAGIFASHPSLALSCEDSYTSVAQTLALESMATLFLLFVLVPAQH
jgi:hypothetical protein